MRPRIPYAPLLALSLGGPLLADTIYLTDGKAISEVAIVRDALHKVEYRKDRKTDSVETDTVLYIEFTDKPQLVDRADTAIQEDMLLDAEADLESFVGGLEQAPSRKHPWARAYALFRLVEVHQMMVQMPQMAAAVDRLGELEPDSRYLPMAQVRLAQSLLDTGKSGEASKALGALARTISAKGLSDRWKLEHELRTLIFDDSLKGAERQKKLEDVAGRAGVRFPVVRNQAEVAVGEQLFSANDLGEAEKVFEGVTADPRADSRTLAAAYTGLGDCLRARGEPLATEESGKQALSEALAAYMRVVVVYKTEQLYVPKAMFYGGRCFQLIAAEDSEDNATKLFTKVIRTYPNSRWAQEAKGFRNKPKGPK